MQYLKIFTNVLEEIERLTLPDQLGVEGFGIQMSSLEHVFMKMVQSSVQTVQTEENRLSIFTLNHYNRQTYTGCTLIKSQVFATYFRKCLYMKRHWKQFLWSFILICISNILIYYGQIIEKDDLLNTELKFDWQSFHKKLILFIADKEGYLNSIVNVTMLNPTLNNRHPVLINMNVSRVGLDDILLRSKLSDLLNLYIGGIISGNRSIEIIYNPCFLHAIPNILISLTNALAKHHISLDSEISIYNDPLPYTLETKLLLLKEKNLFYVLIIHTLYILIISMFAYMPANERFIGLKLQQLKSGLSASIYWIVHLHIDITLFMIVSILPMASIIYDKHISATGSIIEYITIYLIILLAGTSALVYLYSLTKFIYHGAMGAAIFNSCWITSGPLLLYVMTFTKSNNVTCEIWCKFYDLFVWFPSYASASALYKTLTLLDTRVLCNTICHLRSPESGRCSMELLCSEHFQEDFCCSEYCLILLLFIINTRTFPRTYIHIP